MHLTNKSLEVKQIDSIYIWTDPLNNNANIMNDRQPLLSRNLQANQHLFQKGW